MMAPGRGVDPGGTSSEPVGMIAKNLDVSAHVVSVRKSVVNNLINVYL